MFWEIAILVASGVSFFIAIDRAEKKDNKNSVMRFFLLGLVLMITGASIMHCSGIGHVSHPKFMPSQIYTVDGQVNTTKGVVVIVEDSKSHVFALWGSTKNYESSSLPATARFAKIGENGKDYCLIPAEVMESTTQKTVEGEPANKQAEKPENKPAKAELWVRPEDKCR